MPLARAPNPWIRLLAASLCFTPIIAFGGAGVALGIWTLASDGGRVHGVALTALGLYVGGGGLAVLLDWWRLTLRPRVIPSFRPKIDRSRFWTAPSARRFARLLPELDRAAARLGVRPLGAFGFEEHGWGEGRTWFPAAEGLRTLRALREALLRGDLAFPARVADDLGDLEEALARVERESGTFRLNRR
jgi:hypothetical protein